MVIEIEGVPASKAFKKEYAEETYKKVEAYIKVIYSFMLKHL